MSKPVSWALEPVAAHPVYRLCRASARCLRASSVLMSRWARRFRGQAGSGRPSADPVFEFHAEAGAPEGALFVDGMRVGTLDGVRRL